jgi:hypothetical protein
VSSRAAPSVRVVAPPRYPRPTEKVDRDAPVVNNKVRMVCCRCHLVMDDCEPHSSRGEFWHLAKPHQKRALACSNNGNYFFEDSPEVEPFMKKGRRRTLKRRGIRP